MHATLAVTLALTVQAAGSPQQAHFDPISYIEPFRGVWNKFNEALKPSADGSDIRSNVEFDSKLKGASDLIRKDIRKVAFSEAVCGGVDCADPNHSAFHSMDTIGNVPADSPYTYAKLLPVFRPFVLSYSSKSYFVAQGVSSMYIGTLSQMAEGLSQIATKLHSCQANTSYHVALKGLLEETYNHAAHCYKIIVFGSLCKESIKDIDAKYQKVLQEQVRDAHAIYEAAERRAIAELESLDLPNFSPSSAVRSVASLMLNAHLRELDSETKNNATIRNSYAKSMNFYGKQLMESLQRLFTSTNGAVNASKSALEADGTSGFKHPSEAKAFIRKWVPKLGPILAETVDATRKYSNQMQIWLEIAADAHGRLRITEVYISLYKSLAKSLQVGEIDPATEKYAMNWHKGIANAPAVDDALDRIPALLGIERPRSWSIRPSASGGDMNQERIARIDELVANLPSETATAPSASADAHVVSLNSSYDAEISTLKAQMQVCVEMRSIAGKEAGKAVEKIAEYERLRQALSDVRLQQTRMQQELDAHYDALAASESAVASRAAHMAALSTLRGAIESANPQADAKGKLFAVANKASGAANAALSAAKSAEAARKRAIQEQSEIDAAIRKEYETLATHQMRVVSILNDADKRGYLADEKSRLVAAKMRIIGEIVESLTQAIGKRRLIAAVHWRELVAQARAEAESTAYCAYSTVSQLSTMLETSI